LNVKDLGVSISFYEKLGFPVTGGDREHYPKPGTSED